MANAAADAGSPPRRPAAPVITIGHWSQQDGRSHASIHASVRVTRREPGRNATGDTHVVSHVIRVPVKSGASSDLPEPYPPLSVNSPLAQNPQPVGPGSFWYPIGAGRVCMYAPSSVLPCFTLVGAGAAPGGRGLSPQALAASVADRLPLSPGRIRTSPERAGLTGAVSWFWLEPAPTREALTVALAGESVSVTADPSRIEWRFGDGATLSAGPGRPYQPGPPPEDGVVHTYQTRCLPGDQGRNPYVLASCGSGGYMVEALVAWRISFSASGPIDGSGALPTRTTATSILYPVSESRAFLVGGGSR